MNSNGSSKLPPENDSSQDPLDSDTVFVLVLLVFAASCAASFALCLVCYSKHQRTKRRRKMRPRKQSDAEDTEGDNIVLGDDIDQHLRIKIWGSSSKTAIQKGQPIHKEEEKGDEEECSPASSTTMALFPDFRGFGTFCWSDDTDTSCTLSLDLEEEEEDHHSSTAVGAAGSIDLVDAGVFKRTLGILKEQPRCVLCSVGFKVGDKVSVCHDAQVCNHQYHQDCIKRWMNMTQSNKCPVCRESYITLAFPTCQPVQY